MKAFSATSSLLGLNCMSRTIKAHVGVWPPYLVGAVDRGSH